MVRLCCLLLASTMASISVAAEPPSDYAALEPVNQATLPTPSGGDPHPEEITVANGHDGAQNLDWAEGQGYVHAPIADVWAALQNRDVVADRRHLTSVTVLPGEPAPGAEDGFTLQCITNSDPSITYVEQWRSRATQGSADDPQAVIVRADLIQEPKVMGITAISTLSDSIVLEPVGTNTTSISVIRHVVAFQSKPSRTGQYLTDLFHSVVATVHGEPLPTY